MNQQTYVTYMQEHYNISSEGPLTDFLSRQDGQLIFGDDINLSNLALRYGTPLEVVYYPQITKQVQQMRTWAEHARLHARYEGNFLYAYATKANFAADVVQTALAAGAHYETSAATDVEIARYLWEHHILPADRLVCCNGSKEPMYLDAIRGLRYDGCTNVIPVIDDLEELDELSNFALPFKFGVRERAAGNRDGTHLGNDRFGLTPEEIAKVADHLATGHNGHQLVLYHAMVGSQVEDSDHFLAMLQDSIEAYCQLRQRVPSLRYFNFGGGMPTSAYRLGFSFDYQGFLERLMEQVRTTCEAYGVPMPDIIGEFGRYTVANHSLYLFEVGKVKHGHEGQPDWYLINGSLMVSIPDMLLVQGQEFIVLPLEGWDAPVQPVRLAGRRTCDSDDVYPRPSQPPLMLPNTGQGMVVAVCGIGAYQKMISGMGGVHHCLSPEPRRVVFKEIAGHLVVDNVPQQEQETIMRLLGYQPDRVEHAERVEMPKKRKKVKQKMAS